MFKELPILECEDNYSKAMNYLILALTAYNATAEVMLIDWLMLHLFVK